MINGGFSGTYAHVNLKGLNLGSRGILRSPLFNPMPRIDNQRSPYYKSCQVRFAYHKYGAKDGFMGLQVVQIGAKTNVSTSLWWKRGKMGDFWYNEVVNLPSIRNRYHLYPQYFIIL